MTTARPRPEDLEYLRICGTCYRLYDTGRPDGKNQSCRCAGVREESWPGFDFKERARLCSCCGLEVLTSGSRWSPFLCRECQLLAMGVSVWHRRLVFPIGRHSLMHTWVPSTPSPSLAAHGGDAVALADTVLGALNTVSKGSDGLDEWYRVVMPRNLQRLGLFGGGLLREYLEAVAHEDIGHLSTRLEAFEGLCEFFKIPKAEAVPTSEPVSVDAPARARSRKRPPAAVRDLVYGTDRSDRLVFIPVQRARHLARVWQALQKAKTWADLKRLAPPAAYREIRKHNDGLPREERRADAPFDYRTMTNADEGDYPAWPAQEMLDWMPAEISEEFGEEQDTWLNGPFLELNGDAKQIAARLTALGFTCRHDSRLVALACGGEAPVPRRNGRVRRARP